MGELNYWWIKFKFSKEVLIAEKDTINNIVVKFLKWRNEKLQDHKYYLTEEVVIDLCDEVFDLISTNLKANEFFRKQDFIIKTENEGEFGRVFYVTLGNFFI